PLFRLIRPPPVASRTSRRLSRGPSAGSRVYFIGNPRRATGRLPTLIGRPKNVKILSNPAGKTHDSYRGLRHQPPGSPDTRDTTMSVDYQVQKAGLGGDNWTTVCRGPEAKAREVFQRQLRLYSVGRFRLLDAAGRVLEERKAEPLFSTN